VSNGRKGPEGEERTGPHEADLRVCEVTPPADGDGSTTATLTEHTKDSAHNTEFAHEIDISQNGDKGGERGRAG
jgi:hypothetical protein